MYKMTQNKKIKIVNMFFRFRFNIYITLCKNDNSTSMAITYVMKLTSKHIDNKKIRPYI